MTRPHPRPQLVLLLSASTLACATAPPAPVPTSAAEGPAYERLEPVPTLPEIEARTGPLELDLVYPAEGATITARDSTFVFGSTGTAEATLRINGEAVDVEPNGAFLAFLPVPHDGIYRLEANTYGEGVAETAALDRRVRIPEPLPALRPGSAVILEGTVFPTGGWSALPDERIRVGFQGSPGGHARIVLPDGSAHPLVEERITSETAWGLLEFTLDPEAATLEHDTIRGVSIYRGYIQAQPLASPDPDIDWPTLAIPYAPRTKPGPVAEGRAPTTPEGAYVELVVGTDTVREPVPLNLAVIDPARPPVGVAANPQPIGVPGHPVVVGRTGPAYTYHYFWPNGTRLTLTGERDGEYRVQLTETLSAWVAAETVTFLPRGTPPATGRVGTVRLSPTPHAADVRISMAEQLPFRVDVDDRTVRLEIYGGYADTGWLQYGPEDPFVDRVEWAQPEDELYQLTVHLNEQPWGYMTEWAENGDLLLRVRRPPTIDPDRPLEGRLIAIDAGHPPGGATGPTRLTEAETTLAIAERIRSRLQAQGARVLMTRTDTAAVPLAERPYEATIANAEILVSVHNNAFPDGVNPFENNGTSVYYFQPFSVDLARALQTELVSELRLRDLGIGRANLALARPTWMPAALTETMYLMVPQQEAALRNPAVVDRIAHAHVRAIEDFFRARARARER